MQKEIRVYRTLEGKEPFIEWLEALRDAIGRAHITTRLDRVAHGNYGDCKLIGEAVYELRIHNGPGYRVYFAEYENTIVLLLLGGNKSTQERDIKKAKRYWAEFRGRPYD